MHFTADLGSVADTTDITRVLLVLKKDSVELADPRAELADDGTRKAAGKNKEAPLPILQILKSRKSCFRQLSP